MKGPNLTIHSVFSVRWPQAAPLPRADYRALPEVNAILSSFGADVAQLRDITLNRLISLSIPRSQSCVTYRAKRNDKTSIHLPPETFTTETYSVLMLLYHSYTINSNSCYFSLPENKSLVDPAETMSFKSV